MRLPIVTPSRPASDEPPADEASADASSSERAAPRRPGDSVRAPSVRPLAKLFAAAGPLWVFDREGRIVYASADCGRWLGIDPERLLGLGGRLSEPPPASAPEIAALPDALEGVAAALASPAGVERGEVGFRTVRPPAASPRLAPPPPRQVLYVPLPIGGAPLESGAPGEQSDASWGEGERPTIMAFADARLPPPATAETQASRQLVDEVHRQLALSGPRGSSLLTLGASVAAERLKRQIELASQLFTHVTLVGPAGNPVEGIVRRIHAASPSPIATAASGWAAGPLVPVAGPLMDAELFDATTGSLADRLLEEETATAALLIHEIDQMPRDAQGRLELLLNNHPQRLRVFATSTRPAAVWGDALLSSLAARLSTLELTVPALGERVEDIPLLAAALLERRRVAGETRAEQLGRDALDRLVLYPWPGNFSELDAAIRNAARQCRGETIRVEHLPLAIRSYGATPSRPAPRPRPKIVPLDEALQRLERELIARALEQADGNRAAAARILQISRPRLLRRIEQLGIDGATAGEEPEPFSPEPGES